VISFKIPEEYLLRKLPETFVLKPENGGAKFSYLASLSQNVLTIKCTLQIEKQIFNEDEYGILRAFFVEVNRKISEGIELDKKI
jgi:hypothetical protein